MTGDRMMDERKKKTSIASQRYRERAVDAVSKMCELEEVNRDSTQHIIRLIDHVARYLETGDLSD